MIGSIRHIGIVTPDMDASRNFYSKYLGFFTEKEALEGGRYIETLLGVKNASIKTVKMRTDSSLVQIELIYYFQGEVVKNGSFINRIGPSHFAMSVGSIDETYALMKSDGVHFISSPVVSPDGYAKVAFCKSPEGTFVELVELLNENENL